MVKSSALDCHLSSWQHYDDDISRQKAVNDGIIVKKMGFILNEKGMGSSRDGEWRPSPNKPDDQRFLGEPNTTNRSRSSGKRGGYDRDTKYD